MTSLSRLLSVYLALSLVVTAWAATAKNQKTDSQKRALEIKKLCKVEEAKRSADTPSLETAIACVQTYQESDRKALLLQNEAKQRAADQTKRVEKLKKQLDKISGTSDPSDLQSANPDDTVEVSATIPANAVANAPAATSVPAQGAKPSDQPAPTVPSSTLPSGTNIRESRYNTPSACNRLDGTGASNHPGEIAVTTSLLMPKEASDIFGRRLGKRYVIYQVSVTNLSSTLQYATGSISVDLKDILTVQGRVATAQTGADGKPLPPGGTPYPPDAAYLATSRELSLLRGVPEKGQDLDPRNLTLHIFQGLGSVAGGVSGLTTFSDVMGSAVAAFNGPFIQSFTGIAPDHTANQLNRLSDAAFVSNTLVDKLHTRVFSVFIPEAMIFSRKDQDRYWKNPSDALVVYPLDRLNICVNGSLLTEAAPATTPVILPDSDTIATGGQVSFGAVPVGTTIYWTTDDTVGTDKFTAYAAPFVLSTKEAPVVTVRAFAKADSKAQSPIASRAYKVQNQVVAPTISPASGAVATGTALKIQTDTVGASIYVTLDGSTPSADPTLLWDSAKPKTITAAVTVKAFAVKSGMMNSQVSTGTYMIAP